jgi:hypothetical protein
MASTALQTLPGKSSRRRRRLLAEFLAELRADHPDTNAARLRALAMIALRPRVDVDEGWQSVVFDLMAEGLKVRIFDKRPRRAPTLTAKERQEQRLRIKDEMKRRLDDHIEDAVTVRLLDYVTLIGTPLGDCTGADCKKLSIRERDFYGEIAKRLRPGERVRNHLSEDELQAIHRSCRLAA